MIECPHCRAAHPMPPNGALPSYCSKCRLPIKPIADRYQLKRKIGTGGYGVVYLAFDLQTNTQVALKLLRHDLFEQLAQSPDQEHIQKKTQELIARFQHEMSVTAKLSLYNRHIVRLIDIGEDTKLGLYYTMEYLEGKTLNTYLEPNQPIPYLEAFTILDQLCKAMSSAHVQGIAHRDLKPSNIFLIPQEGEGNFVKVIDFGIAKTVGTSSHLTQVPGILGSMSYISPEQAQSQSVDHRTDIYALGGIFYRLLTGTPPFIETNSTALLFAHIQQTVPSFQERCPELNLPPALSDAVIKAMAKNPDVRYQSVQDFWQAVVPYASKKYTFKQNFRTVLDIPENMQQMLIDTATKSGLFIDQDSNDDLALADMLPPPVEAFLTPEKEKEAFLTPEKEKFVFQIEEAELLLEEEEITMRVLPSSALSEARKIQRTTEEDPFFSTPEKTEELPECDTLNSEGIPKEEEQLHTMASHLSIALEDTNEAQLDQLLSPVTASQGYHQAESVQQTSESRHQTHTLSADIPDPVLVRTKAPRDTQYDPLASQKLIEILNEQEQQGHSKTTKAPQRETPQNTKNYVLYTLLFVVLLAGIFFLVK